MITIKYEGKDSKDEQAIVALLQEMFDRECLPVVVRYVPEPTLECSDTEEAL